MARFLKTAMTFAAGWAVAHLFDPVSGRSRRARYRDQLAARARDTAHAARGEARHQAGRMKGKLHEAIDDGSDEPANDAELLQKVRSEAVGPSGFPTKDLVIDVTDGTVVLRGHSADKDAIRSLIERIHRVTGVHHVRSELTTA